MKKIVVTCLLGIMGLVVAPAQKVILPQPSLQPSAAQKAQIDRKYV